LRVTPSDECDDIMTNIYLLYGQWEPDELTNGRLGSWEPNEWTNERLGSGRRWGSRERSERREEVVEEEWRIDRLLEDELTAFNVDFGS